MIWELVFLGVFFVLFLGGFYLFRWASESKSTQEEDKWRFTNPGDGV